MHIYMQLTKFFVTLRVHQARGFCSLVLPLYILKFIAILIEVLALIPDILLVATVFSLALP